jgi:hypothetical protein
MRGVCPDISKNCTGTIPLSAIEFVRNVRDNFGTFEERGISLIFRVSDTNEAV